jgi:uncharacterized OB-fold protein
MTGRERAKTIPVVDYLCLDDGKPTLTALACEACGARYFDHREACASCGSVGPFTRIGLPSTGLVGAFTIVHRAATGVRTPFVSALVYLDDGTAVRANIVNCPPVPERVRLNMRVGLVTFELGTDSEGTSAIGFGFEPV